jgi:hypothetical protein
VVSEILRKTRISVVLSRFLLMAEVPVPLIDASGEKDVPSARNYCERRTRRGVRSCVCRKPTPAHGTRLTIVYGHPKPLDHSVLLSSQILNKPWASSSCRKKDIEGYCSSNAFTTNLPSVRIIRQSSILSKRDSRRYVQRNAREATYTAINDFLKRISRIP